MQQLALVIEDDLALRVIYRRLLAEVGFEVLEACDGAEALRILESWSPQLIFLDILLPKVSGQAVLDYLDSAPHLSGAYVVVVSSGVRYEELVHSHPLREFILKPILPAQIREVARRALTVVV